MQALYCAHLFLFSFFSVVHRLRYTRCVYYGVSAAFLDVVAYVHALLAIKVCAACCGFVHVGESSSYAGRFPATFVCLFVCFSSFLCSFFFLCILAVHTWSRLVQFTKARTLRASAGRRSDGVYSAIEHC